MKELKEKFESLSSNEKLEFIKEIMPAISELFKNNTQEMMMLMMPEFQKMMAQSEIDMSQMMNMMSNMQNK